MCCLFPPRPGFASPSLPYRAPTVKPPPRTRAARPMVDVFDVTITDALY